MFNLLAGQGLGFSGSQDLSFGLAPVSVQVKNARPGGGMGRVHIMDNAYSIDVDDQEIMEVLMVLFGVIE